MNILVSLNCNDQALASILTAVKNMLTLIQIIGPILLLIMASIHFFNLMRNPDEKKNLKKVINSFIAAAVLFFVPLLVGVVMQLLGSSTTISDCWNSSRVDTNPSYQDPYSTGTKSPVYVNPSEYQ